MAGEGRTKTALKPYLHTRKWGKVVLVWFDSLRELLQIVTNPLIS
jgi:hypothetical protein